MTFQPNPSQERMLAFVAGSHDGVLATIRADGRPQLSNITYLYEPDLQRVRISVTATRAKARNLARDPRASVHVTSADFGTWAVVQGDVTLSAIAAAPDDAAVEELIDYYRSLRGEEHPDWDDYRRAMVAEGRQMVRLAITGAYGQVAST